MRLLWEQEGEVVSDPVRWLCIGTAPEWDVRGSYSAEPLLWPGEQTLGLLVGLRQPSSIFFCGNALSEVGAASEWWKDADAHRANRIHLEQPRMVNGQLPGLAFGSKLDTCLVGTKHIGSWACVTLTCKQTHFMAPTAHPDAPGLFPRLPRTFPS